MKASTIHVSPSPNEYREKGKQSVRLLTLPISSHHTSPSPNEYRKKGKQSVRLSTSPISSYISVTSISNEDNANDDNFDDDNDMSTVYTSKN